MKLQDVYHEILKKHKLPDNKFAEPLLFLCLLSYNQFSKEEIGNRLREFDDEKLKGIETKPEYLVFLSLFYLFYYKTFEKRKKDVKNDVKRKDQKS